MDTWELFNTSLKENQERWKKIEEYCTEMEYNLSHGLYAKEMKPVIMLLITLVDQMRPSVGTEKAVKQVQDEIDSMLDKMGFGNKR